MNLDATIFGQFFAVLGLIVVCLTAYYSRNDMKGLPLVILYSLAFNMFIPPLGWYYCWKKRKQNQIHSQENFGH